MAETWNSLEIAKLAVAALTPILLLALGYMVSRATRRSETLIGSRLKLYEKMAPKLNDVFCCFALIGQFQEITPPDAIALKRQLDRTFHAHAPLFSSAFRRRYQLFIDSCFHAFVGKAEPAKLRTFVGPQKRERGTKWNDEWESKFDAGGESSIDDIANAYDDMMDSFASDVGAPRFGRQPRPWLERVHGSTMAGSTQYPRPNGN
jgi:hypothetical protein